ncbi:hypothetical protein SASPL_144351 [Salvia splendens]|uniref:At1g61320/AtMIF1 LRR domain-containing protein n=1 Tax=Salvia splendens TaxID=180675 RepID=A0A8X8WEN9_SALSN|nr:hypothetical protein SASPL_144351 [Salvia splendens]
MDALANEIEAQSKKNRDASLSVYCQSLLLFDEYQIDGSRVKTKLKSSGNGAFDTLPDELLIKMHSKMNVKEAIKMSVLAHMWEHLCKDAKTLRFDLRDAEKEIFFASVYAVVKHHKVDRLVRFAVHREVSKLRVLDIESCLNLESLEISAAKLVSLLFLGIDDILVLNGVPGLRDLLIGGETCISFLSQPKLHSSYSAQLEKLVLYFSPREYRVPNVAFDFPQLCSLKRLDVHVHTEGRQSLLFLPSLIKASPQLCEFVIVVSFGWMCMFTPKAVKAYSS